MNKIFLIFLMFLYNFIVFSNNKAEIKFAFFKTPNTDILLQTYINGFFKRENISVKLYSMNSIKKDMFLIPTDKIEFLKLIRTKNNFGNFLEKNIIKKLKNKELNSAVLTIPEFILAISKKTPIKAVCLLGFSKKLKPEKSILLVKSFYNKNIKLKTIISGKDKLENMLIFKEFLKKSKLNNLKFKFVNSISKKNDIYKLNENKANGLILDFNYLSKIELIKNKFYYYNINSEISQAIIVFHNDIIKKYPNLIEKFIKACKKQIKLSPKIKFKKNLKYKLYSPSYSNDLKININIINKVQEFLLKYKYIIKKVDINKYIDNSFTEKLRSSL